MAETATPLLIKRYASRRLYNTETSDYVTLEDIAGFIRAGREVQIIDLKSGDDLTRQYLLQIVAEHESKGDTVLPTNVLTDLVRRGELDFVFVLDTHAAHRNRPTKWPLFLFGDRYSVRADPIYLLFIFFLLCLEIDTQFELIQFICYSFFCQFVWR